MPYSASVNSNIFRSASREALLKIANNPARKGRSASLHQGKANEGKRAQNNPGVLRAMSLQKRPLCLVHSRDTSEPVQRTKVLFESENQENSAAFKAWAEHYEGWFEDTPEIMETRPHVNPKTLASLASHGGVWGPEVRKAFLKYAPEIIEALPDVNKRMLASLTTHVGVWAPEVLEAFLKYAPQIMEALPDLKVKVLVILTYRAGEKAPEVLEAFLKYVPEIIKALSDLNIKTLITLTYHTGKRAPEVLEAFCKDVPKIKETLPDFRLKVLVTLTCQAGERAPKLLKTVFEHVPTIKKVLPNFTGTTLVSSPNGTSTAVQALMRWGTAIKELLPDVKDEWLIAVAIQKRGYKKLQVLLKLLSKNKKKFRHFDTLQLIQMSTFEESGVVGLSLLKKLQMSTFDEGHFSLNHPFSMKILIRKLPTFPFERSFFLYLSYFRRSQLHKLDPAEAENEWRLLDEYEPPAGMDPTFFVLSDPNRQLSRRTWNRLLELYAWGPSTGLTIDVQRALFNKYLGRVHSPNHIYKSLCRLRSFSFTYCPESQRYLAEKRTPDDLEEASNPPPRAEPSFIDGLKGELDDLFKSIRARLRQGRRLAARPLQFFFNWLCALLPFKPARRARINNAYHLHLEATADFLETVFRVEIELSQEARSVLEKARDSLIHTEQNYKHLYETLGGSRLRVRHPNHAWNNAFEKCLNKISNEALNSLVKKLNHCDEHLVPFFEEILTVGFFIRFRKVLEKAAEVRVSAAHVTEFSS